jgi:phosphate transport system substrate-binding protein
MKRITTIMFLIALIVLSSCASKKRKEQTISISGAFALYPLAVKWAEEYQKENPDVRFNISGGGAGKGMADALSGAVDLGMFSREIAPEEIKQGVYWIGLTIDAVVPTINAKNPYISKILQRGLTRNEFRSVFITGETTCWGKLLGENETRMVVMNRSDACGAAETWAKYLGAKQEDLQGIGVYADPGMADAVMKEPHSIGFNNTIYAYDVKTGKKREGIEIAPIDINENGKIDPEEMVYDSFDNILKAIADGVYPSPPARELYFVSKGKPAKESVLKFIKWTLTDGQKFVKEAGYVPIASDKIAAYLEKLK